MRTKLLLPLFLTVCSFILHGQASVTLYSDCSYTGTSQNFSKGIYYLNQSSIGTGLSSIRIPSGMTVTLYTGNPGSGSKLTLVSDVNCLKSYGWNDKAYSMEVEYTYGGNNGGNNGGPYNGGGYNNNKGVTLYKDCNYGGSNVSLGAGYYNTNEMGIGDDAISSIRVSNGYSITLFENASFSGKSTVYNDDVSCLGFNWNDRVSSIRITRDNQGGGYNNNNNAVVTLYADCKYQGDNKTLGIGYYNANDLGIGNDALSSLRISNGYSITVYSDINYKGSNTTFNDDVYCMSGMWNDRVSSIYVYRSGFNNNNGGGYSPFQKVTLWEDCNYMGASSSLGIGYYNVNQLGISNDALSSLTIPPGYSVTLYRDDRQKGWQTTLTANTPCLSGSWNDKVSSIRIFKTGN